MQTDPMVAKGMQRNGRGSIQNDPKCRQFREMKNEILLKIVTFVTNNSEAKK